MADKEKYAVRARVPLTHNGQHLRFLGLPVDISRTAPPQLLHRHRERRINHNPLSLRGSSFRSLIDRPLARERLPPPNRRNAEGVTILTRKSPPSAPA